MNQAIGGRQFRGMVLSAAHSVENEKKVLNKLNVFPVPDGDTGTNMSLTLQMAEKELAKITSDEIGEVADKVANALLRGARGNSGVILSLLFRGIARGLKDKETASAQEIASALSIGVETVYKAVMKPSEGTILTVARESAEAAARQAEENGDCIRLFEVLLAQAEDTLARTPDMLPVLKQANVVDAGGKGLCIIYASMLSFLKTGRITECEAVEPAAYAPGEEAEFDAFNTEDITFAYCTEFIINKQTKDDPELFREYLGTMGDSVVMVDGGEIIKVHIHTNAPGKVIDRAMEYGPLSSMKIDNMKEQHTEILTLKPEAKKPVPPEKRYGVVAVCAGKGFESVFRDLNVDRIVTGGQTMNPSTEELVRACESVPAEIVFVLPNNKNIIMAAQQANTISDREIIVIPTRTMAQGVCAMLEYDEQKPESELVEDMTDAARSVKTAQVTFAARNSEFDGKRIKKDQIMGMCESRVEVIGKDKEAVALETLAKMIDGTTEFVTIYYGEGVTEEEADALKTQIEQIYDEDLEVTVVCGGQPVYYYIIAVE